MQNDLIGAVAIGVADGISSSPHAQEGARFVTQHAMKQIQEAKRERLPLAEIFISTRDALNKLPGDGATVQENDFGTTLILAVETATRFQFAYVGNGGIWHLRGNMDCFPHHPLPWTIANYLNPHAVPNASTGKSELYKSFAVGANDDDVTPTVLEISKDERYGDIVVICTDGIYSFDEVQQGKDPRDQTLWISAETCMPRLIGTLQSFLRAERRTTERLQESIDGYLNSLIADHTLEDDATVAVLITNEALKLS